MLDKIMVKGLDYFPNWAGKKIKTVNMPLNYYYFDDDGNLHYQSTSLNVTITEINEMMIYKGEALFRSNNSNLNWFKLTDYLKNGGVWRRLKSALNQWLGGVCYG